MKILVLSDSHGYLEYMCRAIDYEHPHYVVHLGDHSDDAQRLMKIYPMLPIMSVRGNCDRTDILTEDSIEAVYDGIRVWASHGHAHGVKGGLLRLFMAAKEKAVHIALFGHTHCAFCDKRDDIWLLNPGSCGYNARRSYGVISISNGAAECSIKDLDERML